jgi:general secretion pathway protein G
MKNKNAFTMIEVIFVIVIIGILASVAIPKLTATRSDAEGAKLVHNLSVCIEDAGGRYMMNGSFQNVTQAGGNQTVSCKDADICFNFTETDHNGSLTVANDITETSKLCQEAQRIADHNLLSTTHTINF